jgi:lysophospholipase L1-like esterase
MNWLCVSLLIGGTVLNAQNPPPEPTREQLEQELAAYRRVLMDFGGLTRYGSENAELRLRPGEKRVVFLGDEITENWGTGKTQFFPGKPYINRGITRQTSAQMLVRFRQDVIDLKPAVVVIEAGTNDLASVMGPSTEGTMSDYFRSMVELAKAHGIRVVLASVPPVCDCFQKMTARRPIGKIIGINNWLKSYAAESGSVYLDYYGALVQGRAMNKDLTVDGLLPNDAGYDKMAPLAEKAIEQALAK